MKIAFITHVDIFGQLNYGGVIEARRHYDLLIEIYGKENVYTILVIPNIRNDNDNCYVYKRSISKLSVLWNCLNLRVELSRNSISQVANRINALDVDIVFFDSCYWWGVEKRLKSSIKTVLFEHNVEKKYAWNRVINKSFLTLPKFFAVWHNEKKMVAHSDKIICLTQRDSESLKLIYGRHVDMIMPISFEDKYDADYDMDSAIQSELLFVGSNFPPNLEGLTWFVNEIMSKVDATLTVVGKDMEKAKSLLERDNVNIVGTVEDTAPYYYGARIVVMPIMWGDGMKVKTAEAMMYGKTILASSESLNGYDIKGSVDIFLCEDANDYIRRINEINIDEHQCYSSSVRAVFTERYEHKVIINHLKVFLDALIG